MKNLKSNSIFILIILSELFFTLELFPEFIIARVILFGIILYASYMNNRKFLLSINVLLIVLNFTFVFEKIRVEAEKDFDIARATLEAKKIKSESKKNNLLECSNYSESKIINCIYQNSLLIQENKKHDKQFADAVEYNRSIQGEIDNLKIKSSILDKPNILFLILVSSGLTLIGFYINFNSVRFWKRLGRLKIGSDKRKKLSTNLSENQFKIYTKLKSDNHNLSEIAIRLNYSNRFTLRYALNKYLKTKNTNNSSKIITLDTIREGKKLWKS